MFKLTLDQVIASMESLNPDEKEALKARLPEILGRSNSDSTTAHGQSMENIVGDVQIGGSNAAFNFQPVQAGGDANVASTFNQGSARQEELLQALSELKKAIQMSESLPQLSKVGAETQVEQLAAEVQKENPDKNLIGRTITALHQGLKGIQDLAGPVVAVASIVAKAWGIPVP